MVLNIQHGTAVDPFPITAHESFRSLKFGSQDAVASLSAKGRADEATGDPPAAPLTAYR